MGQQSWRKGDTQALAFLTQILPFEKDDCMAVRRGVCDIVGCPLILPGMKRSQLPFNRIHSSTFTIERTKTQRQTEILMLGFCASEQRIVPQAYDK